jgi:stearoyl-CoA desaturase (delta-9 desaturase)
MAVKLLDEAPRQASDDSAAVRSLVQPQRPSRKSLPWPETTVRPREIQWRYAIAIPAVHALACLAFIPWLFSRTGVASAIIGDIVFGTLGITLCYHRLLAHRSFVVPKWLEHSLAIIGVCSLQDTPACWVAMHRLHHQHSDDQPDPHSPLVNFFWGHCGWLMFKNREFLNINYYQRFTRDILRDPFYMKLERYRAWAWIYAAYIALYFAAGAAVGWLMGNSAMDGVQFGLSLVVWGVFVRTVITWHITWSVNSLAHVWGYQNYDTGDSSRNNFLVGIWSNGEGWHNNHHADQRAARHGHKWWELDVTWLIIRFLEKAGLAWDVERPNEALLARRRLDGEN